MTQTTMSFWGYTMSLPAVAGDQFGSRVFHVTQTALCIILIATMCTLAILGRDVPGWMISVLGTILGYYLGSTRMTRNAVPD